jgi:hypothetical protein
MYGMEVAESVSIYAVHDGSARVAEDEEGA